MYVKLPYFPAVRLEFKKVYIALIIIPNTKQVYLV